MPTTSGIGIYRAFIDSVSRWISENILQNSGLMHFGVIAATYFPAWLLSKAIERRVADRNGVSGMHLGVLFHPAHFVLMMRYIIWLAGLWFCQALFIRLKLPGETLHIALNLVLALLLVRFATFLFMNRIWARTVYAVCLAYIGLRVFGLWHTVSQMLDSMTVNLGAVSFSLLGVIRAAAVLLVLWAVGSSASRLFSHWLVGKTHLNYSDRVLIQRVANAAVAMIALMVSLNAAGIHFAAIAVTGGAIGLGIGVGLQKLGSNLVSGIHLLLSKPIRKGDVIAIRDSFKGGNRGWVTRIGLMYVSVATPDGAEHMIPNDVFITSPVENLSYSDNRLRLRVPFGIAYKSDLKKAMQLALEATRGAERVLKAPEPNCIVTAFGDSNVMLEVRFWIEDPHHGIGRVKSTVFLAIWDIFHNNGIEFAFPQRDLHVLSLPEGFEPVPENLKTPETRHVEKPEPTLKDLPAAE